MAGDDKKLLENIDQKLKDGDDGEKSEDYVKLLKYGLDKKIAAKIDDLYKTGKFSHNDLDERAIIELKLFSVDDALKVLNEFMRLNLEYISNKAAYLCGAMTMYKKKCCANLHGPSSPLIRAPGNGYEDRIKKFLEETGYPLEVTAGQRKYGPPPNWDGPNPGKGCEIFCGNIPTDIFEDQLIPLFHKCGKIFDFRLMMDPSKGKNSGYAFISFASPTEASNAVKQLNNYEIKPGKLLGIKITIPNLRLFVGNIPKSIGKTEIFAAFAKLTGGLVDVIIYGTPDGTLKNRGFCFLEYNTHKAAVVAKRHIETGRTKLWACDIVVDWADPQEEPDEQTMSTVKILYVKNLTEEVTEDELKKLFEQYGKLQRVKKMKDYAFIHFEKRDNALKAMGELNGKKLSSTIIKVSLAKPPSDKTKRQEILRARERRMAHVLPAQPNLIGSALRTHPNMIYYSTSPQGVPHDYVYPMPLCAPMPVRSYGHVCHSSRVLPAERKVWPTMVQQRKAYIQPVKTANEEAPKLKQNEATKSAPKVTDKTEEATKEQKKTD